MMKNKKEEIIYGLSMCVIMAYFMGLFNIVIYSEASFNYNVFITSIKMLPITFIIAFLIENLFVKNINNKLSKHFIRQSQDEKVYILFNCLSIVTMMSMIMTIVGGFISSRDIITVLNKFFETWPRNFCMALFLNLLFAGPISRFILKKLREFKLVNQAN